MAVQAPAAKPTAPNRNDKPSEGTKSSPELSDGSQEVFEDAVVASADVVVSGTETSSIFATSTPVVADSTQTTSSAWKPYRQSSPQSMGACTSAVTTSGSSSMTVASSQEPIGRLMIEKHNGDMPAPHRPFHLQGTSWLTSKKIFLWELDLEEVAAMPLLPCGDLTKWLGILFLPKSLWICLLSLDLTALCFLPVELQ